MKETLCHSFERPRLLQASVMLGSHTVVTRQLQSILDFGPVVKPLGITVKKEAGKVVETSGEWDVVKPQATKSFEKGLIAPIPKKGGPKRFSKF